MMPAQHALVFLALLVSFAPLAAWSQAPLSPRDACLLQALRDAKLSATVAELQLLCQPAQASSSAPAVTPSSSVSASPTVALPSPSHAPSSEAVTTTQSTPSAIADSTQPSTKLSVMQQRMASELRAHEEPFALLPHHPNFVQPASYFKRSDPDASPTGRSDRKTETMFQLSFKFPLSKPLLDAQLVPFFAYTGRAWWQVYDGERS
jgi:outer membrane phospholipase A